MQGGVEVTEQEALKILIKHNAWRRGDNVTPYTSKVVGEAIDVAIQALTANVKRMENVTVTLKGIK